jgi:hypothetical protein
MKKRINLAIVLLVLVLVGAGRALANATPLATGSRTSVGAADGRLAHIDCPSDPYEENGSFAAARMIEVGGALWAYICPEEDDDWYKFGVTSGRRSLSI